MNEPLEHAKQLARKQLTNKKILVFIFILNDYFVCSNHGLLYGVISLNKNVVHLSDMNNFN